MNTDGLNLIVAGRGAPVPTPRVKKAKAGKMAVESRGVPIDFGDVLALALGCFCSCTGLYLYDVV